MKTKIYLLPGIMTNEMLWSKLLPYFPSNEYELIHVAIPLKNSFDEIVEDLSKMFKNKKINLLGFSLGGYISTYFALKYPTLVNKVFVIGSSPCALVQEEVKKRQYAIDFVKKNGLQTLAKKKIATLVHDENENDKDLIKLIQDMYTDIGKDAFLFQFSATLTRGNLEEELKKYKKSMTFYYCKDDRLVNQEYLKNLRKVKKEFVFIQKDGKSHMTPLENANDLSLKIKDWVNS